MSQLNQIPIKVGIRKNSNTKSPSYGKFYPEVLNDKTISTRALMEHIMSHGLGIPRAIVQAVLVQLSECLTELLIQGQPVKLDGFGTFKLSCVSQTGPNGQQGIMENQIKSGLDITPWIGGLRLVVIPDNTELDKLTSKANLAKASVSFEGVIKQESAGTTATGNEKKEMVVIPAAVYYEQLHPSEP